VTSSTGGGGDPPRSGEPPDFTPTPVPPTHPDAGERPSRTRIGSRDGLIAVTVGIVLVFSLAVVTLILLRKGSDPASTVSIATSAFGVISALVGAFLGIKIGTEQTQGLAQGAQRDAQAANARAGALQTYIPDESKSKAGADADRAAAKAGEAAGRRGG